jgi:hypothetical protein
MKGGDEPPGGRVDVNRHVDAGVRLDPVEGGGYLSHRLIHPGVGDTEDRDDSDRVLVHVIGEAVAVEHLVLLADRHQPRLDIPVVGELLPADLNRRAHHQVRLLGRLAGGPTRLRPAPLQGEATEHARLRGADRRGADRPAQVGSVPGVGEDPPAAFLDCRRHRVLVLVDHVLVDGVGVEGRRHRSIQVPTNVARFIRALPSSIASS